MQDLVLFAYTLAISIHALREEGDAGAYHSAVAPPAFLSTPSARRATKPVIVDSWHYIISIHALREEGDSKNREKIPAFGLV